MLVSDIRLYREGLQEMLVRDGRLLIVAAAASVSQALKIVRQTDPDVVLLDMGLAESHSSIRSMLRAAPSTRVISLGISECKVDVIACAEAGAAGYVSRESSIGDLVRSVNRAVREELHCSAEIAGALLRQVAALAAQRGAENDFYLTPRENEVARDLDLGLTNKQIAKRLNIEVATVKVHVHNILDKVGARSRGEAAARLRHLGIVQPARYHAEEDASREVG